MATVVDETTGTPEGAGPERLAGTTLATAGLVVAAGGPALLIAADPGAAPMVAPFVAVPAVGAALARRGRRWSLIVALVLGLVLLLATVAGPAGEGLGYPASFFDFVPGVMFLLGGLGAVAGGLVSIRAGRGRGSRVTGHERGIVSVAVAGVAVVMVVSGVASAVTNTSVAAADRAGAVEVVMQDAEFVPETLPLVGGETTTLLLRNEGRVLHTFTSDALGVDETLLPGDEMLVEVTPDGPGTVAFWCEPHSSTTDGGERDGMAGTARVG